MKATIFLWFLFTTLPLTSYADEGSRTIRGNVRTRKLPQNIPVNINVSNLPDASLPSPWPPVNLLQTQRTIFVAYLRNATMISNAKFLSTNK